jgi:hypothetical protein
MKKTLVILLMLLLTTALMHAQKIGVGIKAGANFASQKVDDVLDIDTKGITDYHIGAYLNFNINDHFGIRPEVLYSATGSKWNDVQVDFDYIAIPIMLRVKPISLISLEAGPQFSFLTKAESSGIGDIMDQVKKNDFGLAFGAGLNLPFGFNVGARYVLGFSDVSDVSETSIKNRTFQLSVGWTFLGAK